MNIPRKMTIGATLLLAAMCGACASPAASSPTRTSTLLDRVPSLVSAQMTPTRDGGMVLALNSYRGSRELPGARFTVLALDADGGLRWRVSLPGGWPLAQPVQPDRTSIVVGSATHAGGGGVGSLSLHTLSSATGRVLRRDVFASLPLVTGIAPTLLADARGDVAAVLATQVRSGAGGRSYPMTVRLTRRAGRARWDRTVVARGSTAPPAAGARSDGAMVLGYPRRGRFLVRTGTVTGRLGAPADAGPISRNFRAGAVALGRDGTTAAIWQSTTYSLPWRLRAAVRPAAGRRFARYARLGAADGVPGTLLEGSAPAAKVGADGTVTVGYTAPDEQAHDRSMCATATAAARFGPPREVGVGPRLAYRLPALTFGRGRSAVVASSAPTPGGSSSVSTLVTTGADCRVRASRPLDSAAGPPVALALDARERIWVLGQQAPTVDSRRPIVLTIADPPG